VTRRRIGSIVALLLIGGAAAAAARVTRHEPLFSQSRESERPGPDSGRVAKLLDALAATDPLVCTMLVEQMGNFWWNGNDLRFGAFSDAPGDAQAVRDSLHGRVRDARAIALLEARLNDAATCPRRGAAKLLGRSTISTSRLVSLLESGPARVQEAAAYAIGTDERHGARAALESKMTGGAEPIASMSAWALAEMHDSVPASTFLRALESRHVRVRIAGAHGLGHEEEREHRAALERVIRDDDAGVREAVVEALGEIQSALSAPVLAGALGDRERRVRIAAAHALGNLDELHAAPTALVRAAESDDEELAEAAINALAEIHDPATIDVLIGRLSHQSRDIRRRVVEALGNIGSAKAVPGLMRALNDRDPEVRRAAAEALGDIKEEIGSG
jgi:hypothetical protein